jgi:hypothetical protein
MSQHCPPQWQQARKKTLETFGQRAFLHQQFTGFRDFPTKIPGWQFWILGRQNLSGIFWDIRKYYFKILKNLFLSEELELEWTFQLKFPYFDRYNRFSLGAEPLLRILFSLRHTFSCET